MELDVRADESAAMSASTDSVGVSGAPGGEKDEACSKAGIDKVGDQLK